MPSSTPDWSALASQHEKLVTGQTDEGPSAPVPATEYRPGAPARRHARAGSARRPLRRRRASLGAAGVPAGNKIDVTSIAAIPGTTGALAGGFTLPALAPEAKNLSTILQFKS
jgi:hypothetical protein